MHIDNALYENMIGLERLSLSDIGAQSLDIR